MSQAATITIARNVKSLRRAILLSVAYADVFDFPLTVGELSKRLVGMRAGPRRIRAVVERSRSLSLHEGFVVRRGREHLVAIRRARRVHAAALWPVAKGYAGWLARVPFVRMVAVSGSLALDNIEADGDVDVFCITETNRLWVARLFIVPLSKITRLRIFPAYLCPNYILAMDALRIPERDLFTAHEVVQAVPLTGGAAYHAFRRRNLWVSKLLPNSHHARPPIEDLPKGTLSLLVEWMLSGRLGDVLDRLAFRLFTAFYRRRARARGWSWARLAPAYRRNRYVVPEGGYASVVGRKLRSRLPGADVDRLLPPARRTFHDWSTVFDREYGHG